MNQNVLRAIALLLLCWLPNADRANAQAPPGSSSNTWLDSWSFSDTNGWLSDLSFAPVAFANLGWSLLGNGSAVVVDATNALLHYKIVEQTGATNLAVDHGSAMFWFAPSWSGTNEGGSGPGRWGRLIEVGSYTSNASFGWWSLYLDPAGVNIYFSAQTNNGSGATYLSAPIDWLTNRWHLIALTYSATNSSLYLDGQLAASAAGPVYLPGAAVLTNGFFIGSDSNGVEQARGMFDDLSTYSYELSQQTIEATYDCYFIFYYLNPANRANVDSAPPAPVVTPVFNPIGGSGDLTALSTNYAGCVTSTNVWITDLHITSIGTNGRVSLTFAIAGGSNGVPYDVFAVPLLGPWDCTNYQRSWMGQGYPCVTYSLTNLPIVSCFLLLGTPTDSDQDGLTDAYENLVSYTDPTKADTSGDGMLDGWKVLWGLNALANNAAQSGLRANLTYTLSGFLTGISGVRTESITPDPEANINQVLP